MGCNISSLFSKEPTQQQLVDQIFDYIISDPELTEPCILTIAERMKHLTVSEMTESKALLEDRLNRVRQSNAVDLLMVAITDDNGNITYDKFKKHLLGKRKEEYYYVIERLKRVKLHRGNVNFPVRMRTSPEDSLHSSSFQSFTPQENDLIEMTASAPSEHVQEKQI